MLIGAWPLVLLAIVAVAGGLYGVVTVYEYEYGLRFRLGRLVGPVDPGLRFQLPFVDSIRTYTRRIVTVEVPPQSAMTHDNVSIDVSAVVYFRVDDPERTVLAVQDHEYAVTQLAQSTLRTTVGATDLDDVLADRDALADVVAGTIEDVAGDWGLDVVGVELTDIEIPAEMQRVLAAQAEAERERRARTRLAEAEQEAAEMLVDAGEHLGDQPEAMRLRLFQNLKEVAAEANASVVAPIPVDLFDVVTGLTGGQGGESSPSPEATGTATRAEREAERPDGEGGDAGDGTDGESGEAGDGTDGEGGDAGDGTDDEGGDAEGEAGGEDGGAE